jgi:hypothetical protein
MPAPAEAPAMEAAEDEESDNPFGGDDEESDEEGDDELGDEEGEDGEEGDIEDRVMDLEDALEELKAEFEQLMAGEEGEEEHDFGGDEFGGDEFGGDEFGGDEFARDMGENPEEMPMMEYVNKVSPPKHGDNGANTKSVLAKPNRMGGTSANIVSGGQSKGEGTKGGLLAPTTKEDNAGNVNVPGNSKAPKLSTVAAGHGAEKKGKAPEEDKGAQSPLNGVKSRAK